MGFFSLLFPGKKSFLQHIDNGINQIKHGVYLRLANQYHDQYDSETSGLLAAAVTNELFGLTPINEEGRGYLETHKELVEQEIMRLKDDEDILNATIHAMKIKMDLVYQHQKSGDYDKNLGKPYVKLVARGFVPETFEALTPKAFIKMAQLFYKASLRPRKSKR